MSTPNAEDWGSFGNGRSCCVRGAFEIPNIGMSSKKVLVIRAYAMTTKSVHATSANYYF